MKHLLGAILLAGSAAVNAQVVCNTYGTQTICNSLSPAPQLPGFTPIDTIGMSNAAVHQQQVAQLRAQCLADTRVSDKSICYRIQ